MNLLLYRVLQKNPDQWFSTSTKKKGEMLFFFIFIINFGMQSTLSIFLWIHRNSIWKT